MKPRTRAADYLGPLLSVFPACGALAGPMSTDGMWRFADAVPEEHARAEPWVRPMFFEGVFFDEEVFNQVMRDAPLEFTREAWEQPAIIELPMPDGTFQRFEVWITEVMHPDLAAKFPNIRTWAGQGIDDPTALLRMDLTEQGFHSQVLSAEGSFYIDPYTRGDRTFYAVYERNDLRFRGEDGWVCLGPDRAGGFAGDVPIDGPTPSRSGTFLQTYRAAVAATGEYTQFHGGTVALGMAAITTAINRVTGVYEREAAIRLQLVANNNLIVYTNPNTDPYTNNNGVTMLSQNQNNLDAVIGVLNYDIGHVFSTGDGGVASASVVCVDGVKARGVTGLSSPIGDVFYIDYVAHEMGHQFGAAHTYNGTNGFCSSGRSSTSAYEPGSGSTIMAYAGICGVDDLQSNSDDYFLHRSFDQILLFSTGTGGCPADVPTGNTVPTIDAGPNFTIPRQTPFILTAASFGDADGDTLTFCWEERDLGPAQGSTGGAFPDNGSSPIIRSFPPTTSPSRIIPRVQNLLNNTFVIGEGLPNTNRTMNFRCTVRDNRAGGGGVNTSNMQVTSTTAAGPFTVTFPNGGEVFAGGTTVTWNVANTNAAPVNCANVRIELSIDSGNTWPTVLTASTPNDGSEPVVLPSINTSTARVRVMGVNNIFFDISNADFTIVPTTPPGPFSLASPADGATEVSLVPTLSWTTSTNAAVYEVTIDTDAGMNPPHTLQASTGTTSLSVAPGVLSPGVEYFWRVVAMNGAGSMHATPDPASFTTRIPPPPPEAFTLLSPPHGETNVSTTPTLMWSPSLNATSYQVTVDNEPTMSMPFVLQTSTAATSLTIGPGVLAGGTTYYWRVVASNSKGAIAATPNPALFETRAVPPFCQGDANGDGSVGFGDISAVLQFWGFTYPPGSRGGGDANNDGSVNFIDITTVLEQWGRTCA